MTVDAIVLISHNPAHADLQAQAIADARSFARRPGAKHTVASVFVDRSATSAGHPPDTEVFMQRVAEAGRGQFVRANENASLSVTILPSIITLHPADHPLVHRHHPAASGEPSRLPVEAHLERCVEQRQQVGVQPQGIPKARDEIAYGGEPPPRVVQVPDPIVVRRHDDQRRPRRRQRVLIGDLRRDVGSVG